MLDSDGDELDTGGRRSGRRRRSSFSGPPSKCGLHRIGEDDQADLLDTVVELGEASVVDDLKVTTAAEQV